LQNNPKNAELLEAVSGEFDDFALKQFVHYRSNLVKYFEIEGKRPEQLQIVRFEEMTQKIPELIHPFAINEYPFPHLNKSPGRSLTAHLGDEVLLSIRHKYDYICKYFYPELKFPEKSSLENTVHHDKKYLFVGGCGLSGTSVLADIIGSHHQIVLGIERFNKLMRKASFNLSKSHFIKERYLTIQDGDTFYDDFNKFKFHHQIPGKWDHAIFVGVKFPSLDKVFDQMKSAFGNFKYLYIYRNIYDVAESWNRKSEIGGNWSKEKNYVKAVERWNLSLSNTLKQLKNGADIICIHYDDLFFSDKSIQPIFERLGLPIDENVLKALAKARNEAPKRKSAKGTLKKDEIEYIQSNARFELYEQLHSTYNIFAKPQKLSTRKLNLVLHIGAEKTGTTTIQEFLHLNRSLLAKNGVFYIKSIGMRNHRPLATWCLSDNKIDQFLRMNNLTESSQRKTWKEDLINKFEEELSGLNPGIKQVIISSEHFSSLLNQRAEIETLKSLLDKWFANIRVVLYLRRQDSLIVSTFSTTCRVGIVSDNILFNPLMRRPFVYYQKLLNKWSGIFGKESICPVIFEKSMFYNNDLLSDFIRRCGLPANLDYTIPENKNESLSETAQEVAQLFNRKFKSNSTGVPLKELQKIRNEVIENVNSKYPGPGKKPLRHEAVEFYKHFEESNKQVAQFWFGRKKLFNEDFSMYPERGTEKSFEIDYLKILDDEIKSKMDILKTFEAGVNNIG